MRFGSDGTVRAHSFGKMAPQPILTDSPLSPAVRRLLHVPVCPPTRSWPVNPQNPMSGPPGRAPVMKRQNPPVRPGQGGRQIPQGVGPQWEAVEVTAMRAFVCEVPAGRNIPIGQQPGMGQGGFGNQQPGMGWATTRLW